MNDYKYNLHSTSRDQENNNTHNTNKMNTEENSNTTFTKTHNGKFRLNTATSKFRKIKLTESNKKTPQSPKISLNCQMNQMSIIEKYSESNKFKKYDPEILYSENLRLKSELMKKVK